jgi:L-malate glycosyltransferase
VVPVVSQVGAIPDVMQHEVHGLFVPAHDPQAVAMALERLANDRRLLHRLALNARKRVCEQYSITRLAQEFADLYRDLAN